MKNTIIIVITCFLIACSGPKENPVLAESFEIHKSTMKLSNGIAEKIKRMNDLLDNLEEDEMYLKDSLGVLKQNYIDWEASVVEVPGYEDEDHGHHDHEGHDHDHEHDHDHSPSPDLTPEMVLEIQKELNKGVIQLDQKAQSLVDAFEAAVNP